MKFYPEENIYPKPSLIFGGYTIFESAVSLISEVIKIGKESPSMGCKTVISI